MKKALNTMLILAVLILSGCSVDNEDECPIQLDTTEESENNNGTEDPDCEGEECEG